MTAAIVLGAVAIVGEGASLYESYQGEQAKLSAIDLEQKQSTIQSQQKSLANLDLIDKVLARQTAEATTRGVALSSPSFNAIQRETLNEGAKAGQNIAVEGSIMDANFANERENTKRQLMAQVFGSVASMATGAAGLVNKMPTTAGSARPAPSFSTMNGNS